MTLEKPILAVDVAIFCIHEEKLLVLTHQRQHEPFIDAPALPGVAVQSDELLIDAARRAVAERAAELNLSTDDLFLEQLATFDGLFRDPRGRTVSVAYLGVTKAHPAYAGRLRWRRAFGLSKGSMPFDHADMVETGIERLRGKLRYTNIAKEFLPETFRIEEIQSVYEAIMKRSINRTNFRNKLLKIGMIEQVKILTSAVGKKGGRPPHLYRFTQDSLEALERDFL